MEKQSVFDFIKKNLEELGYDVENISEFSSIKDDLGLDSLDSVELVMRIERKFSVSLSDKYVYQPKTIGDLVAAVCKNNVYAL